MAAVVGANGRVRPRYETFAGEPVQFEQYRYELRSYEGDRIIYSPAGVDAAEAYGKQKQQQKERIVRVQAKGSGCQGGRARLYSRTPIRH